MAWSIQYTPPLGELQIMGGTGLHSEAFALGVYENMVERCKVSGGKVELLNGAQVVASFESIGGHEKK